MLRNTCLRKIWPLKQLTYQGRSRLLLFKTSHCWMDQPQTISCCLPALQSQKRVMAGNSLTDRWRRGPISQSWKLRQREERCSQRQSLPSPRTYTLVSVTGSLLFWVPLRCVGLRMDSHAWLSAADLNSCPQDLSLPLKPGETSQGPHPLGLQPACKASPLTPHHTCWNWSLQLVPVLGSVCTQRIAFPSLTRPAPDQTLVLMLFTSSESVSKTLENIRSLGLWIRLPRAINDKKVQIVYISLSLVFRDDLCPVLILTSGSLLRWC